MNIPFFMCRNIERMVPLVQRKSPAQQHKSIYDYALIKIIVMHHLAQQGISWEDFISRDFFTVPQPPPEIVHDEGGPSHQFDIPEPEHVSTPACITYQRGHRALFASAQRVLSPHQVEGVSPSTAQVQVQDRGKQPIFDEGPTGDPDTDIIDLDISSPSSELKEIIQQQKAENRLLQQKLEMENWAINYLEQRNKQLEDENALYELRRIREDRNLARKRPSDLTPIEWEAMLIWVNTDLEKLLAKENRDKDMLRHMKNHY